MKDLISQDGLYTDFPNGTSLAGKIRCSYVELYFVNSTPIERRNIKEDLKGKVNHHTYENYMKGLPFFSIKIRDNSLLFYTEKTDFKIGELVPVVLTETGKKYVIESLKKSENLVNEIFYIKPGAVVWEEVVLKDEPIITKSVQTASLLSKNSLLLVLGAGLIINGLTTDNNKKNGENKSNRENRKNK